jgi:hypothetical protein
VSKPAEGLRALQQTAPQIAPFSHTFELSKSDLSHTSPPRAALACLGQRGSCVFCTINKSGAIEDGPAANRNRARRSSRTTEASDKMAVEALAVETLKFAIDGSERLVVRRQINQRAPGAPRAQSAAVAGSSEGTIHSGLSSRIWLKATNTMSPITAMKNTVGKSSPSIMAGQ